jgi:hypothetical protein
MASSINASTSGAGGVITTADNSGILNLQSAGTTVATVQPSGLSLPTGSTFNAANTFGFKNRIINGNMVIDQRNAGASITPTSTAYVLDRWSAYVSQSSKLSVQQNAGSVTPPAGFGNYLGVTSLSAYSITSTDFFQIGQPIEGFNTADLGWGTANAKTVTLSFQVYSSLTGTFGGALLNAVQNRSYPFTYSIPVANTWTSISITVAGDTTGTWVGATNGTGLNVRFGLGVGATYSGTAGAWAGAQYISATGATSVVGTNGATFYLTGCQLEVGSQATSFDFRGVGTELALCQRYCNVFTVLTGGQRQWVSGYGGSTSVSPLFCFTMRAAPTVTLTNAGNTQYYSSLGSGWVYSTTVYYGNNTNNLGGIIGVQFSMPIDTSGIVSLVYNPINSTVATVSSEL